ncbi:hypothetical protein F5X99DRAFT_264027 [Biscogniauxia marginata]|nr:hypothetical protein F5X99DRAFT_264027 [Biscogniauxia marginata]
MDYRRTSDMGSVNKSTAAQISPPRERRWWTKEEDNILRNEAELQLREYGNVKNWNDIAVLLPGRTNKDCRKRWYKVQLDIRKGAWTPEEDERLHQAVDQLGFKWARVSKIVRTRNADQCAKRWQHVLGPDFKHSPWTPDEDKKLQDAIARYGNNWKQIGRCDLPDRSSHDIRNRSVTLSRRNQRSALAAHSSMQQPSPDSNDAAMIGDTSDDEDECDDEDEDDDYGDSDSGQAMVLDSDSGFEPPKSPHLHPLLENQTDQTAFSDWDWTDVMHIQQQQEPPRNCSNSWFQQPGTRAMPASSNSHTDQSATGHLYEPYFNFNVLDDGLLNMSPTGGGPSHTGANETAASASPGAYDKVSVGSEKKGSVTLILKQVDPSLAQEMIGSLVRHNADLTIRLLSE